MPICSMVTSQQSASQAKIAVDQVGRCPRGQEDMTEPGSPRARTWWSLTMLSASPGGARGRAAAARRRGNVAWTETPLPSHEARPEEDHRRSCFCPTPCSGYPRRIVELKPGPAEPRRPQLLRRKGPGGPPPAPSKGAIGGDLVDRASAAGSWGAAATALDRNPPSSRPPGIDGVARSAVPPPVSARALQFGAAANGLDRTGRGAA